MRATGLSFFWIESLAVGGNRFVTNAIAFRWLAAVVIVLCLQVSSLCAGPPGACATDLAAMTQEHQRLAHALEQWGRQQPGFLSESGAEAGKRRLVLWHPGTELVIPLPYAVGATGSGHHSLPPADLSERLARDFPQLREGWVYAARLMQKVLPPACWGFFPVALSRTGTGSGSAPPRS